MVLATEWGVGQVLWVLMWSTIFFFCIWLAINVIIDIFRSHDMGGVHKAIWLLVIIIIPLLGALIYVVVRADSLAAHAMAREQRREAVAADSRPEPPRSGPSAAEELHRLADLKDRGAISDEEYERLKAQVIA